MAGGFTEGEILDELLSGEAADTESDNATKLLKKAAESLTRAANDRENRATILKEVEAILGKLRIVDFPELADSPVVQAFLKTMGINDLRPGEVKARGTLAEREREWSWGDIQAKVLSKEFKLHKFTPNESLPLTFQGITLYIRANEECEIPDCFYDIYKDHMKAVKNAAIHERYMLGQSDELPDKSFGDYAESARVRAFSMQGQRGQSSGTLTTGRILTEEAPSE